MVSLEVCPAEEASEDLIGPHTLTWTCVDATVSTAAVLLAFCDFSLLKKEIWIISKESRPGQHWPLAAAVPVCRSRSEVVMVRLAG